MELGGEAFYQRGTGLPYHPASAWFGAEAWRLTDDAGDQYVYDRTGRLTALVSGAVRLQVTDAGIFAPNGDRLAIQRNAFGEVMAEYISPVNGRIGGMRSDATSEPGNVLVFILADGATVSGTATYSE